MNDNLMPVIACHECDLLQREVQLPRGGTAYCRRCGGILYRDSPDSLDRTLAFSLAAAILFLLANTFPIIGIELQGNRSAVNLFGAVYSIWNQEMKLISLLVLVTTILVPAFELAMMIYLLLPLKFQEMPPGTALILRILQSMKPWGMVEIFMLGVLVALVKLSHDFIIIPGVALWSFGGLTLMLAAVASSFNARDLWGNLERESGTGVSE
jgi:paraquat-inducible protein A